MFSSCSDLLDLYPEDSLSDPKFWTSVQDLELYANGFYGILPGAQGPGADDESDCYVNEKPKTWIFNLETIPTSGGGWGNGDWGNIRSCNYFMARYKQVKGDESQINRSVAVVRFFRAWEYVYKVKRFGDVPGMKPSCRWTPKNCTRDVIPEKSCSHTSWKISILPSNTFRT